MFDVIVPNELPFCHSGFVVKVLEIRSLQLDVRFFVKNLSTLCNLPSIDTTMGKAAFTLKVSFFQYNLKSKH
jgi:hypothetical protein